MTVQDPSPSPSGPPRDHMAQSLLQSEERFRNIYSQSPLGIEIYDREGRLIDANRACLEMFGIPDLDAVKGFELFEDPHVPGDAKRRLQAGEAVQYESEFDFDMVREKDLYETTKSGRICVGWVITPWEVGGDGPGGYLVHMHDITERRRAEEELRRTLGELKSLTDIINSSPVLAFIWRVEPGVWPVELVSENVTEVLGYTPEDFRSGRVSWPGITHPDDVPRLEAEVTQYLEQGRREWAQEYRLVTKSGEVRWFRDHNLAIADAEGSIRRIQSMVRDVTDRKRAEESLSETHRLLETIFDTTHMLIAYLDPQFNFIRVNQAYATSDGRDPGFFPGKNHFELYPDEENEDIFRRVVATGEPYFAYAKAFEYKDHPERGVTYWDWSLIPTPGEDGTVAGLVFTLTDVTERKLVENALRESEARLHAAIDNLPFDFWARDMAGRCIMQNAVSVRAWGNVLGKLPDAKGVSPETLAVWKVNNERAYAGEVVSEEVELETREGKGIFRNIIAPIRDGDRVRGILGLNINITEQKMAERALRESEDKYRTLVENAEDFIFSADVDGTILSVNAAGARQLGMTPEEVIGRTVFDLYPEELATSYGHSLKQVFETGGNLRVERRLVAGGSELWINTSLSPVRDADGRVVSVLGISRDITARRSAEEALAASEERLRRVITNVPVVLFAVDQHGVFTLSEGKGLAALGLAPGEVVGKSVFEFYADYPAILDAVRRALAGEPCSMLVEVDDLLFDTWLYPITDAHGVTGVIGVAADVTERRRAEEERRRLEEQVLHAQKLESLGILAGGIAHDFNNLLTGVLGNAELALLELSRHHPAARKIEEIRSIAVRAAELTNQMLAYSGRGHFVVEPLDLTELVREMTHLLEVSIARNVTLKLDLADDLPPVEGDAAQLRQVVMNLITNASEAIDDRDGVIALRTSADHLDRTHLAAAQLGEELPEGRYVVLEVTDTGRGMDDETRSRIFDPFFTTKFTGRGLGLASLLGIVRGHRGAVRVESAPGRGTTFRVLLPAATEPVRTTAAQETPPEAAWRGNGTILVVDDEQTVRDVARRMLETVGFDVLTAADGRQAVEALTQHAARVVAVLLDMVMPRTDGEETLDRLRETCPDVRIILTSGYDEHDAVGRFPGRKFCGFIQKPFRLTDLIAKVRGALGT